MVQANPFVVSGVISLNGVLQSAVTVTIKNNTRNNTGTWKTDSAGEYAASLSDPVQFPAGYDVGDSVTVSSVSASVTFLVPSGAGTTVGGITVSFNSVPVSDSGVGSEVLASSASVPVADSGVAVDLIAMQAQVTFTDSGVGADSATAGYTVNVSDSGVGVDALSYLECSLALADSGSGSESVQLQASFTLYDVGAAVDSVSVYFGIMYVNVSDSGSGIDAVYAAQLLEAPQIIITVDGKIVLRISPPTREKPDYIMLG